jgi:hypothetical protein
MTQTIRGELRRAVYAHVQSNPGCTSADVATHFPEQATSVGGTLSHMHDDGLLSRQKKGAHFHYFIPEEQDALAKTGHKVSEIEDKLSEAKAEVAALKAELEDVKLAASEEIGTLIHRIAELSEWRDRAIERYPDLEPTDPLLLRARQIAEEAVQGLASRAKIESIRAGRYDSLPIVQAALLALQSVQQ